MPDVAPNLEVDLGAFATAHAAGATVLDVRNPDEYETAHVRGAVLIPLPELSARRDEIPAGDPLYVICAVGGRSLTAAKALVDAGYPAVSVAGGTNGWIEGGGVGVTGGEPCGLAPPCRHGSRAVSTRERPSLRPPSPPKASIRYRLTPATCVGAAS